MSNNNSWSKPMTIPERIGWLMIYMGCWLIDVTFFGGKK